MTVRRWTLIGSWALLLASNASAQTSVARQSERAAHRPPLLDRPAQLVLQESTLATALTLLSQSAGVPLAFSNTLVNAETRRVACMCMDVTVRHALDRLLEQTPFAYRELRGEVLVYKDVDSDNQGSARRSFLTRFALNTFLPHAAENGSFNRRPVLAQDTVVAGVVVNVGTGQPIQGAQVIVDGTSRGVVTDAQGRFRITGLDGATVALRVVLIGYRQITRTVEVGSVDLRIELQESAIPLDEVVVTGTLAPTAAKQLPTPITVITANDIEAKGVVRIDELFRGDVPGVYANAPGTSVGSSIYVRGSSSVSLIGANANQSGPKIYIDGVEVSQTDRLWLGLDPKQIERIELTRGPQASTLYGSGAINGVLQIFTKKGQPGRRRPHVSASVAMGTVEGQFARVYNDPRDGKGGAPQYEAALSLTGGGERLSYSVGGGYASKHEWSPGFLEQRWSGSAGLRYAEGPISVDASLRVSRVRRNIGVFDPFAAGAILAGDVSYDNFSLGPSNYTSSAPQRTLGLTVTYAATAWWRHVVTLGEDRNETTDNYKAKFLTPSDSLETLGRLEYSRTSLRYFTTADWRATHVATLTATTGVDAWWFTTNQYGGTGPRPVGSFAASTVSHQVSHNTGYFAQAQLGLADAIFLTAGVRAEDNADFGQEVGLAHSPRAGISMVRAVGTATVKLRGSFGSAQRPPEPGYRDPLSLFGGQIIQLANPELGPERQSGWEAGVELYLGDRLSFSGTYYRQTVQDLITLLDLSDPGVFPIIQQYQNIGNARTKGVELEGEVKLPWAVEAKATYSVMESRLTSLGPNYNPPGPFAYRIGDRLRGVPYSAGGLTLTYNGPGFTLSGTAEHQGKLSNLIGTLFLPPSRIGPPTPISVVEYPALTQFHLRSTIDLTRQLQMYAQVTNVANRFPSNGATGSNTIGRTTLIGLRVR